MNTIIDIIEIFIKEIVQQTFFVENPRLQDERNAIILAERIANGDYIIGVTDGEEYPKPKNNYHGEGIKSIIFTYMNKYEYDNDVKNILLFVLNFIKQQFENNTETNINTSLELIEVINNIYASQLFNIYCPDASDEEKEWFSFNLDLFNKKYKTRNINILRIFLHQNS